MSASEANEYDYVYVSEYHNNTNITLNWTESFHESDDCIAHFYVPGYVDWTQIRAVHVVFVALYLIVMVLAICGNSMVIWTVWRHKSMHTATNYYITSLAVSDFFVSIFVLPFKLMECAMDASISPFRNSIALCSVMSYMQPIFVFASIWTLVSVSIDRYLAIMHPLKARSFGTKSRARKIIIAIWTIGCLLMAPFLYPSCLYFYTLESDYGSIYRIICTTQFHDFGTVFVKGWHIFLMLILYFVPLTVLCLTYGIMAARLLRMTKNDKMVHAKDFQRSKQSKSRRKLAKMVLVVVFAFIICWAAYFVCSMVTIFKPSVWESRNFIFALTLNHLFGFANSCINPFIYAIMSEKFREGFKHVAIVICTCRKRKSPTYFSRLVRRATFLSSGRSHSGEKGENTPPESSGAFSADTTDRLIKKKETNTLSQVRQRPTVKDVNHTVCVSTDIERPDVRTSSRLLLGDENLLDSRPHTHSCDSVNAKSDSSVCRLRKVYSTPLVCGYHEGASRKPSRNSSSSSVRHTVAGYHDFLTLPHGNTGHHVKRMFVPVVHFDQPIEQMFCPVVFVEPHVRRTNQRRSDLPNVSEINTVACVSGHHHQQKQKQQQQQQHTDEHMCGNLLTDEQNDNNLEGSCSVLEDDCQAEDLETNSRSDDENLVQDGTATTKQSVDGELNAPNSVEMDDTEDPAVSGIQEHLLCHWSDEDDDRPEYPLSENTCAARSFSDDLYDMLTSPPSQGNICDNPDDQKSRHSLQTLDHHGEEPKLASKDFDLHRSQTSWSPSRNTTSARLPMYGVVRNISNERTPRLGDETQIHHDVSTYTTSVTDQITDLRSDASVWVQRHDVHRTEKFTSNVIYITNV